MGANTTMSDRFRRRAPDHQARAPSCSTEDSFYRKGLGGCSSCGGMPQVLCVTKLRTLGPSLRLHHWMKPHLGCSMATVGEAACSQHKHLPLPEEATPPEGIRLCTPVPQTCRTPKCSEHADTQVSRHNARREGDASPSSCSRCTNASRESFTGHNSFTTHA